MDKGQLITKGRLRASSIMEVVVAMVVIIVIFSIAMMIYANVLRLSLSAKKLRAQAGLAEALLAAEQDAVPGERTFKLGDLQVQQDIEPYHNETQLLEIKLTAKDDNQQQIAEIHKVILKKDE